MISLPIKRHEKYFLSINDKDISSDEYAILVAKVMRTLLLSSGKISVSASAGTRPWWHRVIFDAEFYVRSYFYCEWSGEYANIIFYDDNASEYRVVSSNLEGTMCDQLGLVESKYCLKKEVAIKVIEEFLETGDRPSWLSYEFVL